MFLSGKEHGKEREYCIFYSLSIKAPKPQTREISWRNKDNGSHNLLDQMVLISGFYLHVKSSEIQHSNIITGIFEYE